MLLTPRVSRPQAFAKFYRPGGEPRALSNGLLPISWSSDNGSCLFVNSVDEGSGEFSSIVTASRKSPKIRPVSGIPGNCAGVRYSTPPCRAHPTPWPAVRSQSPRGSGTRREACCETTPRTRSARDSPASRTACQSQSRAAPTRDLLHAGDLVRLRLHPLGTGSKHRPGVNFGPRARRIPVRPFAKTGYTGLV